MRTREESEFRLRKQI
jgi:hypothetical protein